MKNKKFIIIIGVVLIFLFIFMFFSYKFYLLKKYDVSTLKDFPNLSSEEIVINSNQHDTNSTYSTYQKINFIVDDNFIISQDEQLNGYGRAIVYVLNYKSTQDYDASVAISSLPDLYSSFITEGAISTFNYDLSTLDIKKMYKEHNINSTKDLYNAWFKDYNKDVNIFSKVSYIKYNYFITNTSLATKHKADTIRGDLEGYLFTVNNKIYQATIFIGNEPYEIVFINKNSNYFNIDNITEFLRNIEVSN